MSRTEALLENVGSEGTKKKGGEFKNKILAAVSNLSTAYNLTVVAGVNAVLKNQYCAVDPHDDTKFVRWVEVMRSCALLIFVLRPLVTGCTMRSCW